MIRKMLLDLYTPLGQAWQAQHAAKQSYIAFGMAIAAAAEQKVDATPMESFVNEEMDNFLELDKYRLKAPLFYHLVIVMKKRLVGKL